MSGGIPYCLHLGQTFILKKGMKMQEVNLMANLNHHCFVVINNTNLTVIDLNNLFFDRFTPHGHLVPVWYVPRRLVLFKSTLNVFALHYSIKLSKEPYWPALTLADFVVIFHVLVFGAALSPVSHHAVLPFQPTCHLLEDGLVSVGALELFVNLLVGPNGKESPNLLVRPVPSSFQS